MPRPRTTARAALFLLLLWALSPTAEAAVPKRIVFPVVGKVTFYDDFGAPRGSRRHQGNDLMAARRSAVVAVEAGTVEKHTSGWAGDCMLYLRGRSGTLYVYVHLNNDVTRANDNRAADCRNGVAYARGLRNGQRVRAGQLIAFVGNSGNADGAAPHLHFELHPSGGRAVSPYRWLTRARRLLFPAPPGRADETVALFGRFRSADDGALSLRVRAVRILGKWSGRPPARNVALAYGTDLVVDRRTETGDLVAAALASVEPGDRVVVWTKPFRPILRTQLGFRLALEAARVRLYADG
jgi:hypothetical protein